MRFANHQEVLKKFFQEHLIYYHEQYPILPFFEINPLHINQQDTQYVTDFIQNLINLTQKANLSPSKINHSGFYDLLNGDKNSWASWSYFYSSDLKNNETIK